MHLLGLPLGLELCIVRNRKRERLHEETQEETSYVTNDRKKTGEQQVEEGGSRDLLEALHYEQLKYGNMAENTLANKHQLTVMIKVKLIIFLPLNI